MEATWIKAWTAFVWTWLSGLSKVPPSCFCAPLLSPYLNNLRTGSICRGQPCKALHDVFKVRHANAYRDCLEGENEEVGSAGAQVSEAPIRVTPNYTSHCRIFQNFRWYYDKVLFILIWFASTLMLSSSTLNRRQQICRRVLRIAEFETLLLHYSPHASLKTFSKFIFRRLLLVSMRLITNWFASSLEEMYVATRANNHLHRNTPAFVVFQMFYGSWDCLNHSATSMRSS